MRVYTLLKFLAKLFIQEDGKTYSKTMFPKISPPPPPKKKYSISFLFNPVKFHESDYSSQLFDIPLFKDI